MPFIIDIVETKVFNQLTNGLDFLSNTAFFDDTFTGNVEKLRVQTVYELTWYASSDPFGWNVQAGSIEAIGQDITLQGFQVGQLFEFYNNWATRLTDSAEFTAVIDSIQNNGSLITFTVQSGTQTTIDSTASNVGIWCDATQELNAPNSIEVKFGLPLNTGNDTFESLIDSSVQRYILAAYATSGEQTLSPATTTQAQYTGTMTLTPSTATAKNALRLTVKHDLIVNPFYLETDSPDVLINPPSSDVKNITSLDNPRFSAAECLRYIQEIEIKSSVTNTKGRKAIARLSGNTGWFQDNFNVDSKNFELHEGSVILNGGASTALIFGQSNTVQFDIKASDGSDIPANSPFGIYFSVLPPESRYQGTLTNFVSNFVYDCAVNDEGAAGSAGENSLWSAVTGTITAVSGQDMIRVAATLDLTGTTAAFNDSYLIWAGCESPNADISDVSCNTVATSGGAGIEELTISLNPAGGLIIFDINAVSVPDKMEFIHNSVKVATTSMNSRNNGGVYDPASDDSNYPDAQWYIGADQGLVPDFYAAFEADTGITTLPIASNRQQRVWWTYTAGDYTTASTMIVRITGAPSGTAWSITRICQ